MSLNSITEILNVLLNNNNSCSNFVENITSSARGTFFSKNEDCIIDYSLVDLRSWVMTEKQVFTPWCINCETTSKQVEKLAKHYKGSSNLIFARIDASANEHPNLQVRVMKSFVVYFSLQNTLTESILKI